MRSGGLSSWGRPWPAPLRPVEAGVAASPVYELAPGQALPAGWWLVVYRAAAQAMRPVLHLDQGYGFRSEPGYVLPVAEAGQTCEILLRLEQPVSGLRLLLEQGQAADVASFALHHLHRWDYAAWILAADPSAGHRPRARWRGYARLAWAVLSSGIGRTRRRAAERWHTYLTCHVFDRGQDYAAWLAQFDRPEAAAPADGPLLSVLMPVYNPDPAWLDAAIVSVEQQTYGHWELCMADDASSDPAVHAVLQRHAAAEPRCRVVYRSSNGHISAASNSALQQVRGAFIVLLDHDDLLHPQALQQVAEAIVLHPDAGLIYSDEDKIDEHGRRTGPYCKPAWNYPLLLGQNVISHLGVYRSELVRAVGGFRLGLEGSQDYDLALRCIERLSSQQIVHIPRVLYHWRIHSQSAASGNAAKPYALQAAERAITEHLQRCQIAAVAEMQPDGFCRVRYRLPPTLPLVSVLLVGDEPELLRRSLDHLRRNTAYARLDLAVVTASATEIAGLDGVRQVHRPGANRAARLNHAVQTASGDFVCLLQAGLEPLHADWLDELVGQALQPGVGAVGARLLFANDSIQHGGFILGLYGIVGHAHQHVPAGSTGHFARAVLTQDVAAVSAACLLLRRALCVQIGGLDEGLQSAFHDVDLCLRLRAAGYRTVYAPWAVLRWSSEPPPRFEPPADVAGMQQRWGTVLHDDPAYNANLSLERGDFSYAWPPRARLPRAGHGEWQTELYRSRSVFRDLPDNPEMVVIRAGSVQMGCSKDNREKSIHTVILARPFVIGKYTVTVERSLA